MRHLIYLVLTLFVSVGMGACDQSDDGVQPPINSDYTQYGTLFRNVPAPQDIVIYQVNLRAFSEEGTLAAVTQRLADIKALGANVIYLMPIYPNGIENSAGGLGSPYAVRDYKSVSPEYGGLEDLKALVDGAHSLDMAVILDWVANHTAWDNAWISEHPEYYETDEEGNIISPPDTGWLDVAQLDYSNQDLQDAMIDAMAYWVYNANIDGFRCDAADFVPEGFWTKAVSTIDQIKDQEMLMLAEGGEQRHFNSGFDFIFGFHFFETLKAVNNGEPATELQSTHAAEYQNVYDQDKRVVRYTSNHDVNLSDGTPIDLFGGVEGSMASFVVAACMKSVPMIYNGQEIGYDQRLQFFTKTPIDWTQANNELLEEYKQIIEFRKNSPAIQHGTYSGYSSDNVVAFTMEAANESVLVLSNVRNEEVSYLMPPKLKGEWENALNGSSMNLETSVSLSPYSYLILKK
ncbi:alpha-amylase [Muricauda sp. HICW]|uniref:Alpha-amylase n=1 Tax=Flagellimonas chongwuensis TaxID=2697365 RepID=A0A850NJ59_9FLAO|nr:alpha-amylase family glycosyl hydrolase [Allomuricauda chongwuensis]NVN19060.1 alpha-amylase [Allomuricauda chongwuensis]